MDRRRIILGIILMGIFMCSLFTVQALPLLAPFRAATEYGTILLFLGALITGFFLGMLTPSIGKGVFAGFASIVLGLILAGCVLALPSLLGIAGQLGLVSALALERAVLFAVMLTPISAVGILIGSLV